MLFILNKLVHAVESNTSVVTDDTSSAVSVRQTCYNSGFSCKTHFRCVSVKNALIVSFSVFGKDFNYRGVNLVAVFTTSILSHSYSAERLERTLKRLIGLKSDNFLKILVEVSRTMRSNC